MASIRVGTTALNTSTGNQALTISGMTATPKLSLLEVSTGVTAGTVATHHRWSYGVADGTTQRAIGVISESGVAALGDAEGRYDVDTCVQMTATSANTLDCEAHHVSFGAGTHTISIDDAPALADLVRQVFFGGTDISVAIREVTGGGTIGDTVDVTDCGFNPTMAIVFGRGNAAFAADTTFSPLSTTMGYAVKTSSGTAEQFCYADNCADRANPTDGRSTFRNDCCAARVTTAADQGGLTLSWRTGGARFTTAIANDGISVVVAFVLLPSRRLRAIVPSLPTSSAGNQSITGVGFQPFGYFCIATDLASANAGTSGATRSKWSHGCVDDGATAVACTGLQTEDAAATSDTRSVVSTTQFARVLDDAGGDSWSASHVSFGSDGVTINIDDASAADRQVGFVFWTADEVTAVVPETVQILDAQVTQIQHQAVIGETVEILDQTVTIQNLTAVLGETVEVSDGLVTIQNLTAVLGETVEILDGLATLQSLTAALAETVEISDAAVFAGASVLASETVEITDGAVLVTGSNDLVAVFGETVEISDGVVAFFSALHAEETVELLEQISFTGTGVGAIVNETVEISDAVIAYLGRILESPETIEISDAFNFGAGLVAGKAAGGRGQTVQGGAVAGRTSQGGAVKGGTES